MLMLYSDTFFLKNSCMFNVNMRMTTKNEYIFA